MLRIIGHLIVIAFRALGRLILMTLIFGALGALAVALVASRYTQLHWPPDNQPASIALIGFTALAAYAGAATALVIESVKGVVGAAKLVEREATAPVRMLEEGRLRQQR